MRSSSKCARLGRILWTECIRDALASLLDCANRNSPDPALTSPAWLKRSAKTSQRSNRVTKSVARKLARLPNTSAFVKIERSRSNRRTLRLKKPVAQPSQGLRPYKDCATKGNCKVGKKSSSTVRRAVSGRLRFKLPKHTALK